MCAVHFILDKNNRLTDVPIRQMLAALHHRGPDAQGFIRLPFGTGTAFIGNNRLKINDLRDEANQPLASPDRQCLLSFNGEIYNHTTLRDTLRKKYNFSTDADTETLLFQLIDEPENALSTLNGMFGFVFLDVANTRVMAARDSFGMKPLYFFENQDYLIISSEIKGILATGLVAKKLNVPQLWQYLTYRFAQPPETFFEGISEISPGVAETWSGEAFSRKSTPFSLPPSEKAQPPPVYLEAELETRLQQAVVQQLTASVPVGLFLSGGVDSTLLLALASEAGYRSLPVFLIGNSHFTDDEAFARQAARQFQAESFEIQTDSRLLLHFQTFVRQTDQPIADPAACLTYLLASEARRQGIKAVLSGAGADELFGGYHRHQAYNWYLKNQRLLAVNLPWLKQTALLLPRSLRQLQKFMLQAEASPARTLLNFTAMLPVFGTPMPILPANIPASLLRYDQENYLVSDVLKMTDQAAMQASVEVRMPYLDRAVVAFSRSLPDDRLLKNGKKWLLKSLLDKKGGQPYTRRRKQGLGFPFADWLFTENGKDLRNLLLQPGNIVYNFVPARTVKEVLQAHQTRKADYTAEIWAITLLTLWLEEHFS